MRFRRTLRKLSLHPSSKAHDRGFSPANVHFFWADERCVPPNDAESNFRVARELLLIPLKIPDDHIHRIRGEESPAFAVAEAEAEICRIAALTNDSQPMLDLIFLGMGEDGHVASLFPDEAESVIASPAIYRAVAAVKPPPQRITLGYAAIAAARQVWVLASGRQRGGVARIAGRVGPDPAGPRNQIPRADADIGYSQPLSALRSSHLPDSGTGIKTPKTFYGVTSFVAIVCALHVIGPKRFLNKCGDGVSDT